MAASQFTALPFVDGDIDQDDMLRNAVDQLIAKEIEQSGGHQRLLEEYLQKFESEDSSLALVDPKLVKPSPLDAIDLGRYDISGMPSSQEAKKRADDACMILEYERLRQNNMLIIAQVGHQAWSSHRALLENEAKRAKADLEVLEKATETLAGERASMQMNAATTLQDLNESWGKLAFNAAMLRGSLGLNSKQD